MLGRWDVLVSIDARGADTRATVDVEDTRARRERCAAPLRHTFMISLRLVFDEVNRSLISQSFSAIIRS